MHVDCRSELPIWQFTHSKRFPCGPEHANDRNVTRVDLYLSLYCTVFVFVLYCICVEQADLYLIAGGH